jgi:hypothetical protein
MSVREVNGQTLRFSYRGREPTDDTWADIILESKSSEEFQALKQSVTALDDLVHLGIVGRSTQFNARFRSDFISNDSPLLVDVYQSDGHTGFFLCSPKSECGHFSANIADGYVNAHNSNGSVQYRISVKPFLNKD